MTVLTNYTPAPVPHTWLIARDVAPQIAEFLEKEAPTVAAAIRKALARPPGIRAMIENDVDQIVIYLTPEEAADVWAIYEKGREIASAEL